MSPFSEFNGLEFKVNFGGINLIKPEVVRGIVVKDLCFSKTAVVKVNFDVSRAAAGDVPVCCDNATFCIDNETCGETRAFCFCFKDDFGGGLHIHHHRFEGGNLFGPIVCGIGVCKQSKNGKNYQTHTLCTVFNRNCPDLFHDESFAFEFFIFLRV